MKDLILLAAGLGIGYAVKSHFDNQNMIAKDPTLITDWLTTNFSKVVDSQGNVWQKTGKNETPTPIASTPAMQGMN